MNSVFKYAGPGADGNHLEIIAVFSGVITADVAFEALVKEGTGVHPEKKELLKLEKISNPELDRALLFLRSLERWLEQCARFVKFPPEMKLDLDSTIRALLGVRNETQPEPGNPTWSSVTGGNGS